MNVHYVDIVYRKVAHKLHLVFHDPADGNSHVATLYRIVSGTQGFVNVGAASFMLNNGSVMISYSDPEFPQGGTKMFEEIVAHILQLAPK